MIYPKKIICLCGLFLLAIFPAKFFGQTYYYDYGFSRNSSIPVILENDTLSMPWVGGMNSVRFSEIDLNLDGTNDLIGFEKHGNRILPFVFLDGKYTFAPQYIHCFPHLHDWVILKDYNQDGKADIFTYGNAGISVYQNISQDTLAFTLVTDQLEAFYYNGYVNIFASPDDYLVVEDIDNDGDIDILNFWVLGKYVHYLRNYTNNPNEFDFRLESECWGHFEEAADNNIIYLFSDCNDPSKDDEPLRHTGSSMLLHDFTGNGLKDILIGDVDSPNLILLHNNGTADEARMTQQDTCFPINAPVHLYSMPAPSLIHIPNQTTPSLIVSPSDPSLTKSQDINSVWKYDFDSLLNQYTLTSQNFLQEHQIDVGSGCYPVLYDWDNDGLTDLFLANYGSFDSASVHYGIVNSSFSSSIAYYKNTGTPQLPVFKLQDTDFGHLKTQNRNALYPTFGDFDGDGLTDMLCGQKDGTLLLVSNQQIQNGNGPIQDFYLNIDVGDFSAPQYFDLDNDGKKDLLIGNRRGRIHYYRNTGSTFTLVTDTLGGVDVRNYELSYFGYCTPCFYRDENQNTLLFCGSEQGNIFLYKNIDNNLSGKFRLVEQNLAETINGQPIPFQEGKRTAIAIHDLNQDGLPDIIIGNYAGGCAFFEGSLPMPHPAETNSFANRKDISLYPNPTNGLVFLPDTNTELANIRVFDIYGQLLFQTAGPIINLTNYPAGIYIIDIPQMGKQKIIKQ